MSLAHARLRIQEDPDVTLLGSTSGSKACGGISHATSSVLYCRIETNGSVVKVAGATLDSRRLLGAMIPLTILVFRWQGNSWSQVIGTITVLVSISGLAVLLVAAGLRLVS